MYSYIYKSKLGNIYLESDGVYLTKLSFINIGGFI